MSAEPQHPPNATDSTDREVLREDVARTFEPLLRGIDALLSGPVGKMLLGTGHPAYAEGDGAAYCYCGAVVRPADTPEGEQ